MKAIKLVIDTDGSFKLFAEGPEGAAAQDLKAKLEKTGNVVERHVGVHPHGHGHDHGEHEHTHE